MKKEYNTPEWELQLFSFESILSEHLIVSENESGGSGHNDDDDGEW